MIGDIANGQRKAMFVQGNEIEEIATDGNHGDDAGKVVVVGDADRPAWQHAHLDLAGDFQLPLVLFLLNKLIIKILTIFYYN